MQCSLLCRFVPAICILILIAGFSQSGDAPAPSGPQAEKRFPALQLPEGFKATLFACDPYIEYPSVIAAGPRAGTLFVAIDYMTGLGTEIVRRDEVRLLEDTDGDGYADKSTVVADGFNSIQGLAFHDDTLFVMHAPYLSAVREGKRKDLLTGIGLAPEKDQVRLHNANGVVPGHDGWLYLAMGDRGCDIVRPEGDRLVHHGGAILRCRPDGRDLHVFATGLRNIYDVSLDAELNAFVRDNENDGGDYKIRVCHSFFGADHGYPYHYYERPDEALPPLGDFGLGSSAGGVCYLETQFPPAYQGNLFNCEWGRSVVRSPLARAGASFAPVKEIEFAAGASNDPYGFKPTDLVVDRDGSLFISDWADGQRPRRGRGRIYLVRFTGEKGKATEPAAGLDLASYWKRVEAQRALEQRRKEGLAEVVSALEKEQLGVRGRLHAVWVIAKLAGPDAIEKLFALVKTDPNPRVQAQALRAIGDLVDPVIVKHRLDADVGDVAIAERIAALAVGRDARVMLEAIIDLGRLRWTGTPDFLHKNLKRPDAALTHAAQWALRQANNWPAVLKLLDAPNSDGIRAIARRAAAEQFEPVLIDGLIDRLKKEPDAAKRREYAGLLARVYKQPAPWTYWGFRPGPRPANSVAWEKTETIAQALDHALTDSDAIVRLETLQRMVREQVPASTSTLGAWLQTERDAGAVTAILTALRDRPDDQVRLLAEGVLVDKKHTPANRQAAATLFLRGRESDVVGRLGSMIGQIEDGPVMAELVRGIGARKLRGSMPIVRAKLTSPEPEVRTAAVTALGEIGAADAEGPVGKLLDDRDAQVRSAAALTAGKLGHRTAAGRLVELARDPDAGVRASSLEALRRLREPKAIPAAVAALADRDTALKALEYLGELGGPEHARALADLAQREPSTEVLALAGKILSAWSIKKELPAEKRQQAARALAEMHGANGMVMAWHVRGPITPAEANDLIAKPDPSGWPIALAAGLDARVRLGNADAGTVWLASSEIAVPEAKRVEFFTASTGLETIWLNGKQVYRRERPAAIGPYPDRFEADLVKGTNRVLVLIADAKGSAEYLLRLRHKSASQDHERLTHAALSRAGNPAHGREVFLNAEKSLCIKCHRVGDQGERVGPDLTGLGSRFPKAYVVESILEPSRTVSPSFESITVQLTNGKSISGVKVAESDASMTLVDNQVQKHVVTKSDIESQRKQPLSTMPDGLEKKLTEDEFVDLISFLASLRETRSR